MSNVVDNSKVTFQSQLCRQLRGRKIPVVIQYISTSMPYRLDISEKMPSPRSIVNRIFCEWKLLGRASITCCKPCFQQSNALTLASALALALDLACKHHHFSFTFKLRIEETSSSNKTFKTDWKRLLQEYWNLQTCNYSIRLAVYLNDCRALTA